MTAEADTPGRETPEDSLDVPAARKAESSPSESSPSERSPSERSPCNPASDTAQSDPPSVQTEPKTDDDAAPAAQPTRGGRHAKGRAGQQRPAKPRKQRPFLVEVAVLVVVALVVALVVHTFFFQAFFIPSGSMENTLHVGDRVLVNRMSYKVGHPQRGQIVVFNGVDSWEPEATTTLSSNPLVRGVQDVGGFLGFAPNGEKDFIKRVIGVPGDHVKCCDAQGRITVNDKPLDENYLYPGSTNTGQPFDVIVPAGRLWVEGDHRNDSADSRSHLGDPGGGTIPISKVVGRAFVIVWPISHVRWLSIPSSYHSLSSAAAVGLPYGIGAAAVLPVGLLRRRRRRRRGARSAAAQAAGASTTSS